MNAAATVGGVFGPSTTPPRGTPGTRPTSPFLLNEGAAPPPAPLSSRGAPSVSGDEGSAITPARPSEPGSASAPAAAPEASRAPDAPRVFVSGGVRNPGAYAWFPGMTARQLVAAAGGFTPDAPEAAAWALSLRNLSSRGTSAAPGSEGSADSAKEMSMDDPLEAGDTLVVRPRGN
jgi:hypothetical protein